MRTTAFLAVASTFLTLAQPVAAAPRSATVAEEDAATTLRSELGVQAREEQCRAGRVLHSGQYNVKQAMSELLAGSPEELHQAIGWDSMAPPLSEGTQGLLDAADADRSYVQLVRQDIQRYLGELEEVADPFTNWDPDWFLEGNPPNFYEDYRRFLQSTAPYNSTPTALISAWHPEPDAASLDRALEVAEETEVGWIASSLRAYGTADDIRLFLQFGGLPTEAPASGTSAFWTMVEDLKNRWASCDHENPYDPDRVLDDALSVAHQEWLEETGAQAAQRAAIVDAEVRAYDLLNDAHLHMLNAVSLAWLADWLLHWQRYWDGQEPDSLFYPSPETFESAATWLRFTQTNTGRYATAAREAADAAEAEVARVETAQREAAAIAAAQGWPEGRGLTYAQQSAQVVRGMAASTEAAAQATRTAQHATEAAVGESHTLLELAMTRGHAVQAEFRRAAAEEAAEQAAAAAASAASAAQEAEAQAERAREAQDTAEAAEAEAAELAAEVQRHREAAENERETAASARAEAEDERSRAMAAEARAAAQREAAATALADAQTAGSTAQDKLEAAEIAEAEAREAREQAESAERNRDATAARARALQAAAAAAEGTASAGEARQAADEAQAAADTAASAATAARAAADEATDAAVNARAAATEATGAAGRARSHAESAWSGAVDTYARAQDAHAAAAEAIDASEQAAEQAATAQQQADVSAQAAADARENATEARDEADAARAASARATGHAHGTAQSAMAARDAATTAIDPANEAIILGAPYRESNPAAGLTVLTGQAALSVAEQQATAAEARSAAAREAAREARELADEADADARAAAEAAANAAEDSAAALASAEAAHDSAVSAADAAQAARAADERAQQHSSAAWEDAVLADSAADDAERDARAARDAATEAEQDAEAARDSADQAEQDAGWAQSVATEADSDADEAETAAANAREHASAAQEAAERAEAAERERLRRLAAEVAALEADESGSTGYVDAPLDLSDEEVLRQECGDACVQEYREALAQANADVIDFVIDLGAEVLLEVVGVNDLRRCFGDGDIESCLWSLVDVASLIVAVGKLPDVSRAIVRVATEVPGFFSAVDRAKERVEQLRRVVEAARWAPCNSFLPGTGVVLADGGVRDIEDVRVGDLVLATDPDTGRTVAKPVTREITGDGEKNLVDITVTAGGTDDILTATSEHPFWVEELDAWVDAGQLRPGQWLRTSAGTHVQITAVAHRTHEATVHNLTVADLNTYYVSVAGTDALVHNASGCIPELRNWAPRYFQVGPDNQSVQLSRERMNHILIRHHPRYFSTPPTQRQSFFRDGMTISDVEDVIRTTLMQNRAEIAATPFSENATVYSVIDGVRYELTVRVGLVQHFTPLKPERRN
ncbi:hypothetical protein CAG99_26785 [Streptomyces marincola]|uniref:Hint domain-containing protein n=1 Tax=Streptomyces marincola TaxID=2878388 RepID=A0A1W7D4T1_9ACTN|nr:hypothetical protein CAG99_26785 [Streptomyces marincola]